MPDRAIIYVNGNDGDTQEQQDRCHELCTERGYEVVAIATEQAGSADAWEAAHAMIRDGEADRIVVESGTSVPDLLESATGSIRGGTPRRGGLRRIRPVRRDAEA
jgi:hypothetical protein